MRQMFIIFFIISVNITLLNHLQIHVNLRIKTEKENNLLKVNKS